MITLDLRRLSSAKRLNALNQAVTEHVCPCPIVTNSGMQKRPGDVRLKHSRDGWLIGRASRPNPKRRLWWHDFESPRWATSVDAVLPLMTPFAATKHEYMAANGATPYRVDLYRELCDTAPVGWGLAKTFAEAACIALLRAKGVRVIQ